jgi:dipeptidyl aminopeptidase/acylaminoacyl peptidase
MKSLDEAVAHANSDSPPPLLPRRLLFGNPERIAPRLSPDGTRLAYIAPRDGVMNVYVRTVGQTDDRPLTQETKRPVRAFHWAENGRHILYPQDFEGDENFHLYATDVETGETRDLTPFPGARAQLVASDPAFPDVVLLSSNHRDPRAFDVYRCDLSTGELTLLAENPGNLVGWEADRTLAVRAAIATRPDGGSDVLVRDTPEGEWRTLISVPFGESAAPVAFTGDGSALYLLTDKDVNTQRLYRADVATGERELLHARENADLARVLLHPTERTLQGVAYNRARAEWVALDPSVTADFAALAEIDDGDWAVASRDNADRTWLVGYAHDAAPVRYYVYDRETKTAQLLFTDRPELEGVPLAPMTPVEIPARDGLVMPCYLTVPVGAEPKNLPLILNVHGGPWARDFWGLHGEAQWLANRGYAVLQVNYRGSTGFGKAHLNAGNREWAGKMHDDLLDAADWAVSQGIADPEKVAIYGGSYGGYAALVGVTFTPERFACAVDIVGPSSLLTLLSSIPPYWAPLKAQFVQRVGDPDTEADFLRSRSPLFLADKIVRPLLIAQGANDPRVKQAESDQIVEAMRRNGQEVTYLLFPDEGHGFARPENRFKFYAAAEAFLAQHLGGRVEPAHEGEEPPLVEK